MAARFVSSLNALQNNGQPSDRPALDIDTQGLRLSANDENKVHDFFNWFEAKAAAAQAKRDQETLEAKRGPFKILGLHPEVRNMIYGFSAANTNADQATTNGVNLSDHTIPPITLASSLLHQEAIPIFYGETKFFVNVDANLIDRRNRRLHSAFWPPVSPSRQARSGLLPVKAPLKKVIRGLGNAALIRDVTLRIVSTIWFQTRSSRTGGGNWLQMTVGLGGNHPSNTARFPHGFTGNFDIQDISTAIQSATQVARSIAPQAGFHGLTLGNCESIAKDFRSV